MKPSWRILVGDVREKLRECADDHFQCVVTSPPYWGLRDYGVEGQIGIEETPEAFIEVLVGVFREVHRVMRPDATLFLNMGDCYASGGGSGAQGSTGQLVDRKKGVEARSAAARRTSGRDFGIAKPKDLVGQPWMLAFALRDEVGFYLRAENIWHKRSVMPESCTDRTTRAHEQVFMFSKEPTYFYDADAIREPSEAPPPPPRETRMRSDDAESYGSTRDRGKANPSCANPLGRNKRSVWSLGPEPSSEPHFATFPTKLVEPCLLAGTSERGACPSCGSPWKRIKEPAKGGSIGKSWHDHAADPETGNFKTESSEGYTPARTVGWGPSCKCEAHEPIPCAVLDPFSGTATTGRVALKHGRSYCGIELNPKYAAISERLLREAEEEYGAPLFEKARTP